MLKLGQNGKKIKLQLVKSHGFCLSTGCLGGNYKGPAVISNMPAAIDQAERSGRIGEIRPGGHR